MSFTIYTTENCIFCRAVKELLIEHHAEYLEVILDTEKKKSEFKVSTGHKTVPQIYDDTGTYIGNYDQFIEYFMKSTIV